jgi:hypothetical protein
MAIAQTTIHPPVAKPIDASALFRDDESWVVTTTILPEGSETDPTSADTRWMFQFLHSEALKDVTGASRIECEYRDIGGSPAIGTADLPIITKQLKIQCAYHPPVRFTGNDVFEYQVTRCTDTNSPCAGTTSAPAKVTMAVKSQGLRWEIVTNANQSVSSDAPTAGNIPSSLGKTNQDVTLSLDWVFRNPQHASDEAGVGSSTFDGHFVFRTGLKTKGEAVTATALTPSLTTASSPTPASQASSSPPTSSPTLAPKRQFSTNGELNYNWVLPATSSGAFLELGGLVRGSIDADVEGTTTNQEAGEQVYKLVRSGAASFAGEAGVRVTLKQYHRDMFAMTLKRGDDKPVEFTKNSDNFLTAEFGYQRNTGLAGLESIGITPNRYFLRVIATPVEVAGAPGHTKPMIGLELTGGSNQPKEVRVLYGLDLSAIGAALGLGR